MSWSGALSCKNYHRDARAMRLSAHVILSEAKDLLLRVCEQQILRRFAPQDDNGRASHLRMAQQSVMCITHSRRQLRNTDALLNDAAASSTSSACATRRAAVGLPFSIMNGASSRTGAGPRGRFDRLRPGARDVALSAALASCRWHLEPWNARRVLRRVRRHLGDAASDPSRCACRCDDGERLLIARR